MTYDNHETEHMSDAEKRLYEQWIAARHRIIAYFVGLGKTIGSFSDSDVLVADDMMASDWVEVEIADFSLLHPDIIDGFRALLAELPKMLVTMQVCHPSSNRKDWPAMGLQFCDGKIGDGLKRDYLPAPYNSYFYTNSRPDDRPDLPFV